MRTDQATRDETGALRGSGAASERARNAEPDRDWERKKSERSGENTRRRSGQDELILHDDDEAELDLPR
jgi:hypothetical protein